MNKSRSADLERDIDHSTVSARHLAAGLAELAHELSESSLSNPDVIATTGHC